MNFTNAIESTGLEKIYRHGWFKTATVHALKGVNLNVRSGEIFGLLGPNGAGKTTFIKILLGIIRLTAGNATVLGAQAGSIKARTNIGYLPENLRIRGHHTATTAMNFYGQLSNLPLSVIRERRDVLLQKVGLYERRKDSIRSYSKGMLQRLGLAQALLHEPKILIMDEPTDGLDPRARAEVRELFAQLKSEGRTILMNSHILQEVELICDRVAILNKGNLLHCGDVETIGEDMRSRGGSTLVKIDMLIAGELQLAMSAFQPTDHAQPSQLGQETRIQFEVPDQAGVDRVVDGLRQRGIQILQFSRNKVTLEDAFLQLLSPTENKN